MFLVGEMKGALAAQFIKEFESVDGIRRDNVSTDSVQVLLYRHFDKSIAAFQDGSVTRRIEIPQDVNEGICISIADPKNGGVASHVDPNGHSSISLGRWCEDEDGTGFCSEGNVVDNTAVSLEEGKQRYTRARRLLHALEMSFD